MKAFLISHKPDIDGVTPVILSKMALGQISYLLLETFETNSSLVQLINDNYFNNYDVIFITDLSVNKEVCDIIEENPILKSKIKIFDHHKTHLFVNEYSFGESVDVNEKGVKESGTSLFYKYLLSEYGNEVLKKSAVSLFVDFVRQYDTWEWFSKKNLDAKRLTDLFDIFGEDYFINYYYNQLLNQNEFSFNERELYLLEIEQARINRYVEEKSEIIIPANLLEYKVGLVFSENYRSELGNRLANIYQDEYDFIILINLARGVSYRGIKDINLGEIAGVFGGKGHVNSSSSPLPDNIQKDIIEQVFGKQILVKERQKSLSIYNRIKTI